MKKIFFFPFVYFVDKDLQRLNHIGKEIGGGWDGEKKKLPYILGLSPRDTLIQYQ